MRGVIMGFLVWLFSHWTWLRAFFRLRWFRTPPLDQASTLGASSGVEQLLSNEGQHESALATFLSSLSQGKTICMSYTPGKDGFKLSAYFGGHSSETKEFSGDEPTHREFLAALASSKVVLSGRRFLIELSRDNFDRPEQLEEIVGALVSNTSFNSVYLHFRGCSALQMAECVSNLLLGNKAIEDVVVRLDSGQAGVGSEAAELLANGLHENRVLKALSLWGMWGLVDDEAMEVLLQPLKENDSVLQELSFGWITDVGLEHLGVMLRTNTSLKRLGYSDLYRVDDPERRDEVYTRGYTSLGTALGINRSLEHLDCSVGSSVELKVLLEPLMPVNNNPQANTTLTTLWLTWCRIGGKEGVDILVDMIRTNTSLLELELNHMRELDDDCPDAAENIVAILEALKTNKCLKRVSFNGCGGVGGYKVLGSMMDMLLENQQLEKIYLGRTPLKDSGDAMYVHSELEKRKKMKLWDLIKDMANDRPKSGRVFMCGNPHAGKTTLRKSMKEVYETQKKEDFQNKRSSRLFLHQQGRKVFNKMQPFKKAKVFSNAKLENERTWGIEVDHLQCDGIAISIWDMAGQTDYHSFHDLVIPNLSADGSCSLFLLICNPMETGSIEKRNISIIKSEIEYWLRFIASNTRRSWSYRAHVSIVMTHYDCWSEEIDFATRIEDVVEELKWQFQEVLMFDPNREIFKVDGLDESYASGVFDFMKIHLKQLLNRLPKTIKACSEVQQLIAKWNVDVSKQAYGTKSSKLPILKWEDFSTKICHGVEELDNVDKELAQKKQEFVAISLNDGGHIMYHEEGNFIITNPHWFCHDIMGEFLHRCANLDSKLEIVSEYGMISIKHVKQVLLDIIGSQGHKSLLNEILSMLEKLHIYYEQDGNNIIIPSTLQVKCERLSWPTPQHSTRLVYIGRRLSCKDVKQTMFSLGFFPRLQVFFFKKFQNNNVGNSYKLFQDVIIFIHNGIEVIIEFDHANIDILLKSNQCQDKMLQFLENGIVIHLKNLLLNPTLGCPGIILVEHILRPKCVQDLINSRDRNHQCVSMEELELEVMTSGFDARHNWKQCGQLGVGYDEVKSLLGDKAWKKLLQRRYETLQRYQRKILHLVVKPQDSIICKDEKNNVRTSLIWQIPQRFIDFVKNYPNAHWEELKVKLDNIDGKLDNMDGKLDVIIKKIDDVIHMQEDILKMQHTLVYEVSSRIDDLMELSIKMRQSQVPKLLYLSEIGKKKLLTSFIPGLQEFQLHLMCESRTGIHEVVNQQGCKVKFGTNETRTFATMMVWGLKMATILTKIGAHVAGGMGGMVPDFGEALQLSGLILDTPDLLILDTSNCFDQIPPLCLESLPNDVRRSPKITLNDRSKAQEWVIEFLKPKCEEESTFYHMFKLKKVVYKATSRNQSIAWLCDHCKGDGIQSGILYNDSDI